jgi:autotransporter-associated beta strand protein
MSCGNNCSFGRLQDQSSSRNRVQRLVPWAAGLAALAVVLAFSLSPASAQNTPIPGTGFNQNMVVGASETFGSWAALPNVATMDGGTSVGGNTYYQVGQNTGAPASGLPMGTSITLPDAATGGDTFQFQGIDTKNAILLAGDGNGATSATYTLNLNAAYSSLSFLAADGNGNANLGVTLNYVGGSTYGGTINVGDWFNNTPVAVNANGRINSGGYDSVGSNNPNVYYYDLTGLPITNEVQSITFTFEGGGGSHTAIFGISGSAPIVFGGQLWTGATNGNWSLNAGDANWSPGPYSDGSAVRFDDSGTNTTITIAAGGVQPASVLFLNNTNAYSFSGGAISGTASVTLSGTGVVTFNSHNTYSGGTFVNSGTLVDTVGTALGSGLVTVGPLGAVNFTSASATVSGLSGAGSVVLGNTVAPNSTNLTINSTANATFSGSISEAQAPSILTKTGPNTQTLTGNNSYTGGTVINQGTLAAAVTPVGSSLGSGPVTVNNGTKLSLIGGVIQQSGFSGMTHNGNASVSGGVLTLTTVANGGNSSSFTPTTLPITSAGFAASFVYQDVGGNGADGATFCIQSTSATALGGGGGNLGFNQINNSGAVCFNIYAGNGGSGTQLGYSFNNNANNNLPNFGGAAGYIQTGAVNIDSGDPIQVNLAYNGAANTLTETLIDQSNNNTFTHTYNGVLLNTVLAGSSGYVGFTGASGGITANQTISNFQFANGALGQYPQVVIPAAASSELNFAAPVGNVANVAGVTLGAGSTLNVTSSAAANSAYTITAATTGLNGNATINVGNNGTGLGAFSTVLMGPGNLTKGGLGTLSLTGTATYAGVTTINQGVVSAGPNAIGTGNINLNGGTFQPQGPSQGLIASFYRGDPGNGYNGYQGSGFPGTGTQQILLNSQSGLATFLAGLPNPNPLYTTTTAANGNTALNFNGPNGNNGQAFNGTNGPGNIGYTDANGGNDYTAVLSGYIYLPAGTSNFTTRSDDGSLLYIDGNTVVNNNGYQGMTNRSGSVTEATAGYHQIEVAYYQGGGGAGLVVYNDLTGTNVIQNSQVVTALPQAYTNNVVVNATSTIDLSIGGSAPAFNALSFAAPGLTLNVTGTTGSTLAFNSTTPATGDSWLNVSAGNTLSGGSLAIGGGGPSALHLTSPSGVGTASFGPVTIANSPVFDVQGANVMNLDTISGSLGFSKTGAGTLNLTGTGTYPGPTVINQGTLAPASPAALGTGTIVLHGGRLAVSGGVPGLLETYIDANGYQAGGTGGNYSFSGNYSAVYRSARAGYIYGYDGNPGENYLQQGTPPNAATPWSDNRTIVYQGYFNYQPTAGNTNDVLAFAWSIDDAADVYIKNNAGTWVDVGNGGRWNPNPAVSIQGLSTGWHQIEVRFFNGGGGFGPSGNGASQGTNGLNAFGIGYDPSGALATATPNFPFGTTVGTDFLPLADPGDGSLFTAFGPGVTNYSNAVNVTAPSSLDASGAAAFNGVLTLSSSLHATSAIGVGILSFNGGVNLSGAPAFNIDAGVIVNLAQPVGDGGNPLPISVGGAGSLIMSGLNTFTSGTSFQVNGGNLVAVGQSGNPAIGPLGGAPITLNNGTLVLVNTSTTGTTFDAIAGNPITLAGTNDSIVAGSTLSGVGVAGGSVTLAGAGTLPIQPGQTLNLGDVNGYTLTIDPGLSFSNSGTINVPAGSVSLQASNLPYAGGTFSAASGGTLTLASQMTAGIYAPANGGTVILTSYSGSLANLVPQSGGNLVIQSNASAGTLNIQTGIFNASSNSSFGPAVLEFNGGYLGATTGVTLGNALVWGPNPTLNFTGNNNVNLTAPLALPSGGTTYTVNDPNTRGTLSGVISGPGTLSLNGYPTIAGVNTYTGGTQLNTNSNDAATITNNQAFGAGLITFNNGGFNASTPLTGANAIANPWTIPNNSHAYFFGANAIELSSPSTVSGTEYIDIPNNSQGLTVILSGVLSGTGNLVRNNNGNANNNSINGTLVLNNPASTFSGGFTLSSQGGNLDVQGTSTSGPAGSPTSGPLGTGQFQIGTSNNTGGLGVLNSGAAVTLGNPLYIVDNAAYWSTSGLNFTGPVTLGASGLNFYLGTNAQANNAGFTNSSVTFSGLISGGAGIGINLASGSGAGGLTLSNSQNTYAGNTSISYGTLIAGNNVFNNFIGPFGNANTAVTIGDGTSGTNPAALVLGGAGALFIDRPITVNANAGPTTLGDIVANDASTPNGAILGLNGAVFGSLITLTSTQQVTLSAANGGSVTFDGPNHLSGGTVGTITGAGGINAASQGNGNVTLANVNSYTGGTTLTSGQLTLEYSAVPPNGAGTVGGIVPPTSPVTLAGGTLVFSNNAGNGPVSETFFSTQVAGFGSTVLINDPTTAGVQVSLGAITRTGGVLDLPAVNAGVVAFTTTNQNVNGILGGYFTVNGYTDWAVADTTGSITGVTGGITGLSGVSGGYTVDSSLAAYAPGNNVDVQNGGALTASATTNSLRFNTPGAAALTFGGNSLTLQSGGVLVTPTMGTTGGTLGAAGDTLTSAGADVIVLQGNTQAAFTVGANVTNNGTISVGLTKGGPGTLILAGSNTYTGPTTVSGGVLQGSIGSNNFPATTSIKVNAGANVTFLENGTSPVNTAISVTGPGTLTKAGSATLISTAASPAPAGGLNVQAGTYQVSSIGSVTLGPVNVASGATLAMNSPQGLTAQFYNGTNYANTFGSNGNPVSLAQYNTLMNSLTPGTTSNTATNSYAGLNFPDGQTNGPFQGILPASVSYTNNYDVRLSGYLNVPVAGTYYIRTGSDDGSAVWLGSGAGAQQVVNNDYYQGVNYRGSGPLTLAAGPIPISVEYYQGGGGESLVVQYSTDNANWTTIPNSVLIAGADTIGPLSGAGNLSVSGFLTENSTSNSQFDGTITGNGVFTKSGPGTLILTNSGSNLNGTIRIAAGALEIGDMAGMALQGVTLDMNVADAGNLTLGAGVTSVTLGGLQGGRNLALAGPLTVGGDGVSTTYSGNLSGVTLLTKIGGGSFTLSGVNSMTGANVSAGVLDATTPAALPVYSTAGAVSVGSGATLVVQTGPSGWGNGPLGALVSGANFAAGSTLGVDTTGGNATISSSITAPLSLNILGGNTLTLSNSNTFTGPTTVTNGTLNLAHPLAVQDSTVNVTAGGAVTFAAGVTSPVLGGLAGPGNIALATAASEPVALSVGQNGQSTTYGGVLSGPGSLTKQGGGQLTLAGINTYTGPTLITGGTVQILGAVPVTNGLVGFWKLNEGTGTTAFDTSGVAQPANGTLSGNASWVAVPNAGTPGYPPFSTAVQINGNAPGVTMGAISAFGNTTTSQFSQARTISGWVELVPNTNNPGDWHDLFGFIGNEGSGGTFFDWETWGNQFGTHTYGGDTQTGVSVNPQGQWVYLTATATPTTGGANNVFVYVNGQLEASANQQNGALSTFDNFGIELSRGGWNEDVSDVSVYNVALTQPQIAQLYNWHGSGLLPVTTALTIAPNSALDLNGGAQAVASLSDSSPGHGGNVINSNSGSSSVLTLTPATGVSTTFSGTIGDNGSGNSPGSIALVLDGPGTMVLAGTNTYAGGTTVEAGTLVVTNQEGLLDGSSLSVGNNLSAFSGAAVVAAAPAASSASSGIGAVPEPGTLALLSMAGIVAAAAAWRRRRYKN